MTLSAVGLSSAADHPVTDAQWGDFDNDGFLDLYVVRNVGDGSNVPNILFLNNGDATFRDGTEQFKAAGLADGSGDAAAIVDFDKNGFLDLLVSNGFIGTKGPYQLLRNEGNENHWLRVLVTDVRGSPEFGSKVWLHSGATRQIPRVRRH